jgi:hypothetical protein
LGSRVVGEGLGWVEGLGCRHGGMVGWLDKVQITIVDTAQRTVPRCQDNALDEYRDLDYEVKVKERVKQRSRWIGRKCSQSLRSVYNTGNILNSIIPVVYTDSTIATQDLP